MEANNQASIRATLIRIIQLADNGDIHLVTGQVSSAWDLENGAGALRIEWVSDRPSYEPVDTSAPIKVDDWPKKDGDEA